MSDKNSKNVYNDIKQEAAERLWKKRGEEIDMQKLIYNRRSKAASIGRKLIEAAERQRRHPGDDPEALLELVEKQANKLIDMAADPIFLKNSHGVEIDWLLARKRMKHDDEELLEQAKQAAQEGDNSGDAPFVQRIFDEYVKKFAEKHGKEFELAKQEPRIYPG